MAYDDRTFSRARTLRALVAERRQTEPSMSAVPEQIPDDEGPTPPPVTVTSELIAELWKQRRNDARIDIIERDIAGVDKVLDELLRQSIGLDQMVPIWRATAVQLDGLVQSRATDRARDEQFHKLEWPRVTRLIEKIDGHLDAIDQRLTVHDTVQAELGRNDTDHRRHLAELEPLKLQVANLQQDKAVQEALRAQREKADARRLVVAGLAITIFAAVLAVVLAHFIH